VSGKNGAAQLNATATSLTNGSATAPGQLAYWGHGIVNAATAIAAKLPSSSQAAQSAAPSTGTGTLDGARGSTTVTDATTPLTGQQDIFGHAYTSTTMAAAQSAATTWAGGVWNGSRWTGDTWDSTDWTSRRWVTATWTGTDWAGSRWTGSRWTGMTWDGSRWTGTGWNGSRWTGTTWDGSRWTTATWN
jgi:serine protease AprX